MFDKYLLLNRKPRKLVRFYYFILLLLVFIMIILLFKVEFTPYFMKKTRIKFLENNYYLELNINIKEFNLISSKNKLLIGDKRYVYKIYKMNYTSINNDNVVVYLEILNFSDRYKINNYPLVVKI